jgi:membrane fusion protein (multidrug efflux system)
MAVAALLVACGKEEPKQKQEPAAVKVTVQAIDTTTQAETLRYSGSIEAENSVQIGFSVPGTVSAVQVNEGQRVAAGQLLATIDPTEYENALLIASAGLEQAEDMFNRLEGLYKKGSLPAKDYVDIKSKVAQARANKNLAAKRVKDSKLYAPMSGIITSKTIEKGATAAPGAPAFTIINTAKVYARVSVPESEIGKLSKGQQAEVSVATLGTQLNGKIAIINPMADPVTKSYSVKIQLENANGKLLPGMIADVGVQTGQQVGSITIPAHAVVRDADDITFVFVTTQDNKVVRKRITPGGFHGNNIVIREGLSAGEQVVVSGQTKLKDGSRISL